MVLNTVKSQYGNLVNDLAKKLNINPDWVYVVVYNESGWNPNAVNQYTKAQGLFQFMPATLRDLGYTAFIGTQIPVDVQFKIAYDFLKGRMKDYKDLYNFYLSIFYPYAINKPLNFVLGSQVSPSQVALIAKENPGISVGRNQITVSDVAKYIYYKSQYLGFSVPKDFVWKIMNGR